MNNSKTDAASVMIGNSLGIVVSPFMILTIEIPATTTRKTPASPIDNADVYLKESVKSITLIR